jgi:16S rRNA (uracil1498-N3)-methyltransferase
MLHRFFVSREDIRGDEVGLGEQAHQIRDVLRLKAGGHIIVLDNDGAEFEVALTAVGRDEVKGQVIEERRAAGEPEVQITLYQSLLSREKFEWVLQKCTEVGVARFVPLVTSRSIVRDIDSIKPNKIDRWQRIIQEAAEQSHRGKIPELASAIKLEEVMGQLEGFDLPLIASPQVDAASLDSCLGRGKKKTRAIALLVGPEGGFTEDEVKQCCSRGAMAFGLGRRILRTETAAVVACALVLYELDQMEA